jgi:hypothetical protein
MREQIYDGAGGPFSRDPDAPESCVICDGALPENTEGEVVGHAGDACTCSAQCHAEWERREEQRRADDAASMDALARRYAESTT